MRIRAVLFILFISAGCVLSQNSNTVEIPITISIPEVAILDFHSSAMLITDDTQDSDGRSANQIITPNTTDQTWLNYSSLVKDGNHNYISASIKDGSIPMNTQIKLLVKPDAGKGGGQTGNPVEEVVLSYYPQSIITHIGSCFTGSGIGKGHQLIYTWDHADKTTDFSNSGYEVIVTYTIASVE